MTNVKTPKVTMTERDEGVIMLAGVQISFPNLWKPGKYEGKPKPNLECHFIIPADQKDVVKQLNAYLLAAAQTESPKIKKLADTKHPKLKKTDSGYTLTTTNQFDYPPKYYDSKGNSHEYTGGADSDVPQSVLRELRAGNFANAMVNVRPDMVDGKVKVWTNLLGIQFAQMGPSLGGGVSEEVMDGAFGAVVNEFEDSGTSDSSEPDPEDDFEDDDFDL